MKNILISVIFLIQFYSYSQENDQIKELNPQDLNLDFSDYNSQSALYLGQLSELAYHEEKEIKKVHSKTKELFGNGNYSFLETKKADAQVLLWCTPEFLVISFRGTEPGRLKDIITDAKFWNYENNSSHVESLANMPPGHGGFRKSLMRLIQEEQLFERINEIIQKTRPEINISDFPIIITGHSLGAALSQLFIEPLNYKEYNFVGAYHFAPPLAVSCSVNPYMKENYGDMVYDIVNYKDYVPRAGRMGVAHFGKFYRICDDNLMYKEKEAYVKFSLKEYPKAMRYHKLENYLSAVRKQENSLENIIARSSEDFGCMGKNISYVEPCPLNQGVD